MLKSGTILEHKTFGFGIIISNRKDGYQIYFPKYNTTKIITRYLIEQNLAEFCDNMSIDDIFKSNVLDYYFTDVIKQRGRKYYNEGRVEIIKKDNNSIESVVAGSRKYNVAISFSNSRITAQCNCPYGENCKHIYATLLTSKNLTSASNLSEEEKIINDAFKNLYSINYYRSALKLIKFIKDKDSLLKVLDVFDQLLSFGNNEYKEFINVILLNQKVDSLIKKININDLKEDIGFYLVNNKDIVIDTIKRNDAKYVSYLLMNLKLESLNIFWRNYQIRYRNIECFLSALIMEDMINNENIDDFISLIKNHFKSYASSFFTNVINSDLKRRMIIEFDISVKKNDLIDFSIDELVAFFKNYSYPNAYSLYKSYKSNFVDIDDLDKMHMLYKIYYASDYIKRTEVINEINSIEGSEYIKEYLENNRYEGGNYGRFYW